MRALAMEEEELRKNEICFRTRSRTVSLISLLGDQTLELSQTPCPNNSLYRNRMSRLRTVSTKPSLRWKARPGS